LQAHPPKNLEETSPKKVPEVEDANQLILVPRCGKMQCGEYKNTSHIHVLKPVDNSINAK